MSAALNWHEALRLNEIRGARRANMLLMLRKVFPDEDTNALLEALNELIQVSIRPSRYRVQRESIPPVFDNV